MTGRLAAGRDTERAPGGDRPVGIGILGAGNVLGRYVQGMSRFPQLAVIGCAALTPEEAVAAAAANDIAAFGSVEALLSSSDVEVVVNITTPLAHAETTAAALAAGKHVYVEKPLTPRLVDAQRLVADARRANLLIGSAPDTFLGSAAQTARHALDGGAIGKPLGVAGFIPSGKVETWHPDPTFLFQEGGGPVADMGPYYLTAMVHLLGPVVSVMARGRTGAKTRRVTSPSRRVDSVPVTVATHAAAVLEFDSGVIGTLTASFDVWDHHLPPLEVYGTEGTLTLPDPNTYDGDVLLRRHADTSWNVLPPVIPHFVEPGTTDQSLRGPGVADLVAALDGGVHRAGASLACHVLDVIAAVGASSESGASVGMSTSTERPAPARRMDRARG